MRTEDDYMAQLQFAKEGEVHTQEKNSALMDAEYWYKRAALATSKYREYQGKQGNLEAKLKEYEEQRLLK